MHDLWGHWNLKKWVENFLIINYIFTHVDFKLSGCPINEKRTAVIQEYIMTTPTIEQLEQKLKQQLGESVPANAGSDINAALALAQSLETKGFSFKLKDLCPKSMTETRWRAVFSKSGKTVSADNAQSSIAVLTAAVGALDTL